MVKALFTLIELGTLQSKYNLKSYYWGGLGRPLFRGEITVVKVYLKAKTFDDLIVKMEMMNTLSGRQYQFNESYFAKSEFYVTFKSELSTWRRVYLIIEERFKQAKTKKEVK